MPIRKQVPGGRLVPHVRARELHRRVRWHRLLLLLLRRRCQTNEQDRAIDKHAAPRAPADVIVAAASYGQCSLRLPVRVARPIPTKIYDDDALCPSARATCSLPGGDDRPTAGTALPVDRSVSRQTATDGPSFSYRSGC